MLFAKMSGIHSLLTELRALFQDKTKVEKIFIYCPQTERKDYEYIYEEIEEVLNSSKTGELKIEVEHVR